MKKKAIPPSETFKHDERNVRVVLGDKHYPGERHVDPKLRQALTREFIIHQDAKLDEALAARAEAVAPYRRGGMKGRRARNTEVVRAYIRSLVKNHPKASPVGLFRYADKKIIGEMAQKTFANHARALRKGR